MISMLHMNYAEWQQYAMAIFEHIEHISEKGHVKEIHLKRIDEKKKQKISKTKTASTFKVGASKWLKAKEKQ